jgi:large conductance mechanosensitive channel
MLKEFRDFVMRGNLIELAVALILALAFAAVVAAFTNVVLSLVAAIFGGDVSFNNLTFSVNGTPIPYGAFLTALFTFLVVAFILFLVVKAYNASKKSADPTVKTCPFCATDIPIAATRCPHCTTELQTAR